MTLPRFFIEDQVIADQTTEIFALHLSDEDIRHARALRLMHGEHISVIDAVQDYFECAIESFDGHDLSVRIAAKKDHPDDHARVILIQGLAKGEKMDTIIRQGTEVGIAAFVPFVSKRSIVKLDDKKLASKRKRWLSIAKNAAMQSAQRHVPEVAELMDIKQVCDFVSDAAVVVICWEEEHEARVRERVYDALLKQNIAPQDACIAVVVGPEGGLEEDEVNTLLEAHCCAICVSLGSSILRTETAGVLAPALILHDLGALA